MCSIMESSLIRINVGNIVQVFTSVVNPNATFVEMNGFTIRPVNVIPNPTMPFLAEFTVEILYTANNLTTNLNLTCGNSVTNKTLTTVNSEFTLTGVSLSEPLSCVFVRVDLHCRYIGMFVRLFAYSVSF